MNDFNRKVEDASARVSKTVADAAECLEKALRVASEKLCEFADYMERTDRARKQ